MQLRVQSQVKYSWIQGLKRYHQSPVSLNLSDLLPSLLFPWRLIPRARSTMLTSSKQQVQRYIACLSPVTLTYMPGDGLCIGLASVTCQPWSCRCVVSPIQPPEPSEEKKSFPHKKFQNKENELWMGKSLYKDLTCLCNYPALNTVKKAIKDIQCKF